MAVELVGLFAGGQFRSTVSIALPQLFGSLFVSNALETDIVFDNGMVLTSWMNLLVRIVPQY